MLRLYLSDKHNMDYNLRVLLTVTSFTVLQLYLVRVSAVGEDVQQVCRGNEVKPWKGQTLGVQILSQGFLTKSQSAGTGALTITLSM